MLALGNFTSCSNDDDNGDSTLGIVNPGGSRKLKAIYSGNKNTPNDYRYCEFVDPKWDGNTLRSFCYGNYREENKLSITYLADNKAEMEDTYGDIEYITLNNDRCATDAFSYRFKYNENGQMTRWEVDYNDDTYCDIYYTKDGDISSFVLRGSWFYGESITSLEYTNTTVTTPIENKGGIMFFSEWGGLEDYLSRYYWFGLYGKATRHLPVKAGEASYEWTLDGQGYPTKCVAKEYEGDSPRIYYFEWE